jgi:mannitol-1-phosphate 5-dehydrogenase
MGLTGERTYVGFGFGAIQAGLFLCEAFRSGRFGRLVVAEVQAELVADLRGAGGFYSVNIAHGDRIEAAQVGPVEALNPADPSDREALVEAVAEAQEIGTAIPSVAFYATGGPGSLHRILADGLDRKAESRGPRAVVYTAENHNRAAEILRKHVREATPRQADERQGAGHVCFLNTVIGKMSGQAETDGGQLVPITPRGGGAFLVEAFNRILISRPHFEGPFSRGIEVFVEKDDLLPFEEVKLFGHNATHALAAYLARLKGIDRVAELRRVPGFLPFLRRAFVEESGAALIRKHKGVDPLFTSEGYAEYADDLLERMTNPFLMDTAARVGRDVRRKLGWDDRLVGTMRLALGQGVEPRRYGIGAAAALAALDARFLDGRTDAAELGDSLWPAGAERGPVLQRIETGRRFLRGWRDASFPNLDDFDSG